MSRQCDMESLKLSDNAYYTCKGYNPLKNNCHVPNINTLTLSKANTLTDGIPYYYKYGFVYDQQEDYDNVRRNKRKLNILSSDLNHEKMFIMINKKLMKCKCTEQIKTECLDFVADTYERNLNKNVKEFFKELKFGNYFLFCLIYIELWNFMKLKGYEYHTMVMKL